MKEGNQNYYQDQFYGMERWLDNDKLPDGKSPLAVNVDLDRLGTVSKRKGTSLVGSVGSNSVQSIIEYINTGGESEIHAIRNNALLKYNGSDWANVATLTDSVNQFSSVLFKNRVYHKSPDEYLFYEDGLTNTVVGSGSDRIKGKCLAVGQRTLFIGNVTITDQDNDITTTYRSRVYYSLFNTTDNLPGDQFWNDAESGLLTSTRFFEIEGGQVQAMVSLKERNRVYFFTDSSCWTFDIDQVETSPQNALQEIFSIGCCGQRAVTVVDGVMYWMDKKGKVWGWAGNGTRPTEMTYSNDDQNLGRSVISQINKSDDNLSKVSAFGVGKRVYFAIGSIQIDSEVLSNAVIKISLSQNGLAGNLSLENYPDRILCGAVVKVDNSEALFVGNSKNIMRLSYGLNDVNLAGEDVAINSYYRTKHYNFKAPFLNKSIKSLIINYRPQPDKNTFLVLKASIDLSNEYKNISNPVEDPNDTGKIDMWDKKNKTLNQAMGMVNISPDFKAKNISVEFSNSELNQSFTLSSFSFLGLNVQDSNTAIE